MVEGAASRKVYLDVCCLNRPFDDSAAARVAIEAAAVVRVLDAIQTGTLTDYSSKMARVEIARILDPQRRRWVAALLPPAVRILPFDDNVLDAAETLQKIGFDLADAVHLASARKLGVVVFLTVDDKLLKRARKHSQKVGVRVLNPVEFLRELK